MGEERNEEETFYLKILRRLTVWMLIYLVGSYFLHCLEGWSLVDCIYFITVTMTTVGYGDITPKTQSGRIFVIFFDIVAVIFALTTINELLGNMYEYAEQAALKNVERLHGKALQTSHYVRVAVSLLSIMFWVVMGSVYMYNKEPSLEALGNHDRFVGSLYWAVITVLGIGYGDIEPTTQSNKVFVTFFIFVSVANVANAIATFVSLKAEVTVEKQKRKLLAKRLDFEWIAKLNLRDGQGVDKLTFVLGMLSQLHSLDRGRDIDPWIKKFDELDVNGNGYLDAEDMVTFAEKEEEKVLGAMHADAEQRRVSFASAIQSRRSIYSNKGRQGSVSSNVSFTSEVPRPLTTVVDNRGPDIVNRSKSFQTEDASGGPTADPTSSETINSKKTLPSLIRGRMNFGRLVKALQEGPEAADNPRGHITAARLREKLMSGGGAGDCPPPASSTTASYDVRMILAQSSSEKDEIIMNKKAETCDEFV